MIYQLLFIFFSMSIPLLATEFSSCTNNENHSESSLEADTLAIRNFLEKLFNPKHHHPAIITTKLITYDENISNAFNGSIIETADGYLMLIRHETTKLLCATCGLTLSKMFLVKLSKSFDQVSPLEELSIPNSFCPEDGRLHLFNGNLYVTYNDEPPFHPHKNRKGRHNKTKRRMYIGMLEVENPCLHNISEIPSATLQLTPIEKNWSPFEYPANNGNLHYLYMTNPKKIIKVTHQKSAQAELIEETINQSLYNIWDRQLWGAIRGGTPARFIDGQYLTFFHAWRLCPDKKNYYYVMGAYTFEKEPPFKITAITPSPILFDKMYTAPHKAAHVHTTYPAGFAIQNVDTKTILHVSCGENDTSTRIVSIDKDRLLQSMVPIL